MGFRIERDKDDAAFFQDWQKYLKSRGSEDSLCRVLTRNVQGLRKQVCGPYDDLELLAFENLENAREVGADTTALESDLEKAQQDLKQTVVVNRRSEPAQRDSSGKGLMSLRVTAITW